LGHLLHLPAAAAQPRLIHRPGSGDVPHRAAGPGTLPGKEALTVDGVCTLKETIETIGAILLALPLILLTWGVIVTLVFEYLRERKDY